ncbi:4'-phosphopantetheinyl transferase family protein [Streptomyces sp. HUAS TT20]|uniref:4'-phosphopantetheinyl transferase family protein n=1 Tax=Streptomyces sp. HUAS TT20 TaxID=3447509 RepID=UPI0021DAD1EA|nr:4'-phosphopantetheinyl transferase superfamily protein [Streptomyces sp. HUAS 15-9]UXY31121.1 4'-phosphopantetheinyl transferase superfamily protein [Streptomyces sp. HUAS 15-9]
MIEELLPDSVVAVELHGDDAIQEAPLYPEEEALMVRAVAKRRREFSSVRACARRAMEKLGVAAQPILTGESGAPRWPAGLVGSMTHSEGYCAAALVRAADLASLGIDAEPDEPLPEDVVPYVCLPTERERLRELATERPDIHWDRILFSAKESVYKAWFPLTRRWLDFTEADIEVLADPGERPHGALRAELLVPGPWVDGHRVQRFEGRWSVQRGVVTSAVVVPHS